MGRSGKSTKLNRAKLDKLKLNTCDIREGDKEGQQQRK
jgi:hypothetical protein